MRIILVLAIVLAAVAGTFIYVFPDKSERLLPDIVHGLFFGTPDVDIDTAGLIASGAGLAIPYRDKWLKMQSGPHKSTPPANSKRICSRADPRLDCNFRSVSAALAKAYDGQVFVISAGIYKEGVLIKANSVSLIAEPGAHLKGRAIQGKAAIVIEGNDTVIEGLECSGISVGDRNGACIRLAGRNLTLRGVYFHDSEQGVLSGRNVGTLTVEYSLFNRLGRDGRAHGIYMGTGANSRLIVRKTHVIRTKESGHGIKSRAASTLIEDSVIAAIDRNDSRAIDLPNGGLNVIQNNIIQNGPKSENADVVGIGLELKAVPADLSKHRTRITNNIFLLDRHYNAPVHTRRHGKLSFHDNAIVGGHRKSVSKNNFWYRNRSMAGLPPFPGLLQ